MGHGWHRQHHVDPIQQRAAKDHPKRERQNNISKADKTGSSRFGLFEQGVEHDREHLRRQPAIRTDVCEGLSMSDSAAYAENVGVRKSCCQNF